MFQTIITVTLNPSIDTAVYPDRFCFDEPMRVQREQSEAGGKGVNLSRVLASLGCKSAACGIAGADNAALFHSMLDGVDADFIEVPGKVRENLTILTPDGRQLKLNRCSPQVGASDLSRLAQRIRTHLPSGNALIVFAGSIPRGVNADDYTNLIRTVQDMGHVSVALDASDLSLSHYLSLCPFIIKPNREELSTLIGCTLPEGVEAVWDVLNRSDAFQHLRARISHLLLSLDKDGMIYFGEQTLWMPVPPVTVRSTVGAGDSALAGFVYALQSAYDLPQALRFAAACGTAAVTKEGTAAISRKDIEPILCQMEAAPHKLSV